MRSVSTFKANKEDWPTYVEHVEQFCLANNVKEDTRAATLLLLIGSKTYGSLRSLIVPTKPSTLSLDEIVTVFFANLGQNRLL